MAGKSTNAWRALRATRRPSMASRRRRPMAHEDGKARLTELDRVLYELKGQLFDGNLFTNCTEQEFDFDGLIEVRANRAVKQEVAEGLRSLVNDVQACLGGPRESDERRQLVALHGLYAFFIGQWQDPSDRKLFRAIWSLQTAASTAPLFACTRLHLANFLMRHVPMMTKLLKNAEAEAEQLQRARLAELDRSVEATFETYRLQSSVWMARMESNMTNRAALDSLLDARATLLAQGVRLGVAVLAHVQESLELHVSLSAPLGAATATALVRLLELLKAIEATYHRRAPVLAARRRRWCSCSAATCRTCWCRFARGSRVRASLATPSSTRSPRSRSASRC
jgi:WASH complex subunit 7